jgi:hypothetical protein
MQQIDPFIDERLLSACCVYCGGPQETRDHVPSKVLLDDPFPENLPVVGACRECNQGFARDEEYLACLLEVVLNGTTEDTFEMRPKVRKILAKRPSIAARIKGQSVDNEAHPLWQPEIERLENVVLKLARGHAAYELLEPRIEAPNSVGIAPLISLTERQRRDFEQNEKSSLWPEVGSRAMIRMATIWPDPDYAWIEVQPQRYRYAVSSDSGITVKIVMSEYLACEVQWDEFS